MTRLRIIDLETTGMEPPAEIIEFGRTDVVVTATGTVIDYPAAWLYRPLGDIPPETTAVHHITEADFDDEAVVCTPPMLHAAVWQSPRPEILVAHNCGFERKFISEAITGTAPWICTYKVALHVWPEAPRHSNQVLRYWRGLDLDPALAMPPHRAGPDTWVSAHLLAQLLEVASIEQMIAWTNQPRPIPTMQFGKHKGLRWDQIPIDYLQWMDGQMDMDPDVLFHVRAELARR